MKMNCLWCGKPLSKKQIYEAKRGKSKGNACSLKCSNLIRIYKTPQIKLKLTLNICSVCGIEYHRDKWMDTKVCSRQCAGKLSSIRMKNNNPMHYKKIIDKVKIAIEIDGVSHNSLKVQECDKRKTKFLNLKKWKVLRFTNYQIDNQLTNCVLKVLSMI